MGCAPSAKLVSYKHTQCTKDAKCENGGREEETWQNELESEHGAMSEESTNLDLEQLTEQTAEQIIFIVGSAPGDPKAEVFRLLRLYLAQAQEQAYEETLRGQQLEERDQQN